jgi:hypothetical protein
MFLSRKVAAFQRWLMQEITQIWLVARIRPFG